MKVLLAGAFGHLGQDVLRSLVEAGHEVTAVDMVTKELDFTGFKPVKVDLTKVEEVKGLCDGIDTVVTTVGLTKASQTVTPFDIDLGANKNLLDEALRAGVKHFSYISVIHVFDGPGIPMLEAKAQFEKVLTASGISYTIFRPSGYFFDIAHIFQPKVEQGKVSLLKNKTPIRCNVIDTKDFADYITEHLNDDNASYNVGGRETYTFEEVARMFFEAAGKEPVIKYVPPFMFDLIVAMAPKWKKGVIKFGKWTMTMDMVGDVQTGNKSFKEFIKEIYAKGLKF